MFYKYSNPVSDLSMNECNTASGRYWLLIRWSFRVYLYFVFYSHHVVSSFVCLKIKFAILSLLFPAHIHFSGHISLPPRVESVSVSVKHSIKQTNWRSGANGGSSFTFVPFNLRFCFGYRMRRDVPTRVELSTYTTKRNKRLEPLLDR